MTSSNQLAATATTETKSPPNEASARLCWFLSTFVKQRLHPASAARRLCEGNMVRRLKNVSMPDIGTFFSCLESALRSTSLSWGTGLTCQGVRFINPRTSSQGGKPAGESFLMNEARQVWCGRSKNQ
jgi:hypothetical protein